MYFTPYICCLWDFFTICTKGDSGSEMHFISFLWIVDILHRTKVIETLHLPRRRGKAIDIISIDRKSKVSFHGGLPPGVGKGKDNIGIELQVD